MSLHKIKITHSIGDLKIKVDLEFDNSIVMISGENGAGKTTLLRLVSGLSPLQEGIIQIHKKTWVDTERASVLPVALRHVGYVWAKSNLLPWLSVKQNIVLGSSVTFQQKQESWLEELLEQLEMQNFMKQHPLHLSTGEAQRVALARALYQKPSLLLLDEPFSAQASKIRQQLRFWLKKTQKELQVPILMVSHDSKDCEFLADSHKIMTQGRF